ncbi:hypothetical protein HZH68_004285 [Vespula germanica]|uniref:Uncharacterized protein n=1 Tax=Vespula germanica TaxID=30212 RepID=A0A834KRJ3_VESGE|nr:hypothetical protein HZH68_004285 [Vespula germanica]
MDRPGLSRLDDAVFGNTRRFRELVLEEHAHGYREEKRSEKKRREEKRREEKRREEKRREEKRREEKKIGISELQQQQQQQQQIDAHDLTLETHDRSIL